MARESHKAKEKVCRWLAIQDEKTPFSTVKAGVDAARKEFSEDDLKAPSVRNWVTSTISRFEPKSRGESSKKKVSGAKAPIATPETFDALESLIKARESEAAKEIDSLKSKGREVAYRHLVNMKNEEKSYKSALERAAKMVGASAKDLGAELEAEYKKSQE